METALDPEAIGNVRPRWGVRIQNKHTLTEEYECRKQTERETTDTKHKPDKNTNVTGFGILFSNLSHSPLHGRSCPRYDC